MAEPKGKANEIAWFVELCQEAKVTVERVVEVVIIVIVIYVVVRMYRKRA